MVVCPLLGLHTPYLGAINFGAAQITNANVHPGPALHSFLVPTLSSLSMQVHTCGEHYSGIVHLVKANESHQLDARESFTLPVPVRLRLRTRHTQAHANSRDQWSHSKNDGNIDRYTMLICHTKPNHESNGTKWFSLNADGKLKNTNKGVRSQIPNYFREGKRTIGLVHVSAIRSSGLGSVGSLSEGERQQVIGLSGALGFETFSILNTCSTYFAVFHYFPFSFLFQ